MPKIFRSMQPDQSGLKPKIGCEDGPGLGVRVPDDVRPDANGIVCPSTGGMSVSPSIAAMLKSGLLHRIPRDMAGQYPGARGSSTRRIWSFGEGPFVNSPVGDQLVLRLDKPTHGLVEPFTQTSLGDFQQALARTQNGWRKDED